MSDKSMEEVIALAIQREQDAYFFYQDLMDIIPDKTVKETLKWIAEEERKHRKFLVDYRDGKFGEAALRLTDVVAYHIAEHVASPEITPEMTSVEVFTVAAHRELASHQFYSDLAAAHSDSAVVDMLTRIANEELKHKEKMEYLYTNTAFPQTSGG